MTNCLFPSFINLLLMTINCGNIVTLPEIYLIAKKLTAPEKSNKKNEMHLVFKIKIFVF